MNTGYFTDAPRALRVRHLLSLAALAAPFVSGAVFAADVSDTEWHVLIVAANDPVDRLVPPPLPGPGDEFSATTDAAEQVAVVAQADDAPVEIRYGNQPITINGMTYDAVYRSIPYSYTEYLANPGYRHEATMEILFGQLRPTTIHKQYQPQPIVNVLPSPYQPYVFSHCDYLHYRAPAFRLLNPGYCW
jgi:hypothetical protein